ncbi:hypothetical protein [Streptomyces sp. NPDC059802]|uniref:AMP-binding enzyme n=1 Tax=Streptomyces sp. NPDC059802 TaxID=3346952 RepID=UPI003664844C
MSAASRSTDLFVRHPDVPAAAVVAVDDRERGQRPHAYVRTVPGSTLTAAALYAWAAETMATYKVPGIEPVEAFPMTATGKIRRTDFTERARAGILPPGTASRTRPAP